MAAFQLGWSDSYELYAEDKPFRDEAGVTSVPAGKSARLQLLGGYSLGISRNSAHRAEAVRFVQFLIHKQTEFMTSGHPGKLGRKVEFFEVPLVMRKIYPWWRQPGEPAGSDIVSRPSAIAGSKYEQVSEAYSHALHSVLTGQTKAPVAAAALENELVQVMSPDRAQPETGAH